MMDFDRMAAYVPSPVTLSAMLDQSCPEARMSSFEAIRMELPVRAANLLKEMEIMNDSKDKSYSNATSN